jgi:hypothetical protein
VTHPQPQGEHLHLANGVHAVVAIGPAAYQLSTGEIIAI